MISAVDGALLGEEDERPLQGLALVASDPALRGLDHEPLEGLRVIHVELVPATLRDRLGLHHEGVRRLQHQGDHAALARLSFVGERLLDALPTDAHALAEIPERQRVRAPDDVVELAEVAAPGLAVEPLRRVVGELGRA